MKLLDVYNEMTKEAETEVVENDEMVVIAEYTTAADQLLAAEYGEDYNEQDVEKLASMLIEHDANEEIEQAKYAEWDAQGRVMARAFVDELNKEA